MTPAQVKTVFVVEDDPGIRVLLEKVLGTFYSLRSFGSGREALNALQALPPDVLVTDLELGDIDGEDLAWAAGQIVPRPRVVAMSGDRPRLLRAAAWAEATLPKPFKIPALIGAIEAEDQLPAS
jgi:two-component system nitrogen regulation response regulator GlnG